MRWDCHDVGMLENASMIQCSNPRRNSPVGTVKPYGSRGPIPMSASRNRESGEALRCNNRLLNTKHLGRMKRGSQLFKSPTVMALFTWCSGMQQIVGLSRSGISKTCSVGTSYCATRISVVLQNLQQSLYLITNGQPYLRIKVVGLRLWAAQKRFAAEICNWGYVGPPRYSSPRYEFSCSEEDSGGAVVEMKYLWVARPFQVHLMLGTCYKHQDLCAHCFYIWISIREA